MRQAQRGYFLLLCVVLIMVMGVLGILMAYTFSNRARMSVAEQQGMQTLYMAESGLQMASRLITMPSISGTPTRISCASVTGTAAITNAAISSGTFTATTINSSPIFASTTLNGALTSSATTIALTSASGFATRGRVLIDREVINYGGISGNSLIGVERGEGGSSASSHASGTGVGEYLCSLDVQAGIPSVASPSYKREIQWSVPLQDGWMVGNRTGNNFQVSNWNKSAPLVWTGSTVAGAAATRSNLVAVSMLSYSDGWATGDINGSNFIFLRWNGSSWGITSVAGACSAQNLLAISSVSSQEAWAVGARYRPACAGSGTSFLYSVLKWNGSTWSVVGTPTIPAAATTTQNLNAVHVIDTNGDGLGNIGFAVGDGGVIIKYNGSTWVSDLTSPVSSNLNGVYTVSASEAWAVGAAGVILKWNGSTWSSVSSPVSQALNSIVMIDTNGDGLADIGWGVGNSGRIISYNGSTWSTTTLAGVNYTAVDYINQNDVWAIGGSASVIHYNGSAWSTISSAGTTYLAISLVKPGTNQYVGWQQIFH